MKEELQKRVNHVLIRLRKRRRCCAQNVELQLISKHDIVISVDEKKYVKIMMNILQAQMIKKILITSRKVTTTQQ